MSDNYQTIYQTTEHLYKSLVPSLLRNTIKKGAKILKYLDSRPNTKFDTIAFAGMSGALIAPGIALATNKELTLVRKAGDKHHGSSITKGVEGNANINRYIIVDDLVSSGATVRRIQRQIRKYYPDAMCVGVLQLHYVSEYDMNPERENRLLYPAYNLKPKNKTKEEGTFHD